GPAASGPGRPRAGGAGGPRPWGTVRAGPHVAPGGAPPAPAPHHRTSSSRHQGLAVLLDRPEFAVPAGHAVPQRPRRAHHDLGTVLARHREQGLLAQPERLLRLVRL